ncbi:replication restart helicase PriA [Hippea sp. KM1]|uniref:replication restart helicase PriA n=1 Tax=Hippea sp. KM1 TaxID=944481 RepID=UPI00046D6F54|nr:primosomal protein N' [Hippea sp. KM1]
MFFYSVLFPLAIDEGFVYRSDKRLKVGQRVLVDFKGRVRIGVVLKEEDEPDYQTKPVIEQLDEEPVVSCELIKTLEFFSFYFMAAKGMLLRSALPKKLFETKKPIDLKPVVASLEFRERPFKLNMQQEEIVNSIDTEGFSVNLIFGVTGSGKTEVYLSLIERVLRRGKKAVVLVPEIALTPQYIDVFSQRFSNEAISVIHSRLTGRQKFDNWIDFNTGRRPILIGTRSAVFVNFKDVGIVVVDEENDESYKQESQPLYNAKDVAIYRAKSVGIPVILSSATPSFETYYKAKTGKFRMFEMHQRVGGIRLPEVEFVRPDGDELFAKETLEAIGDTLNSKKTVAVLINRRGFSNYLVCGDCGYVFLCPNCSVSLKFHKKEDVLKCHWCDGVFEVFRSCPKCGSLNVLHRGVGSQMIEEELKRAFPGAVIERFDRDSTAKKGEFNRIINSLRDGKIDILIGTQMLSKGHDISQIGLVVVFDFESLFVMPDFRAEERAVSLIMQTAGRSGRREPGRVIIQLNSQDNPFLKYIKEHDYEGFVESGLKIRRLMNYPPFSRLIRVVSESTNKDKAWELIGLVKERLEGRFDFLGPSRCPIFRLRNRYRYHIIIKSSSIIEDIAYLKGSVYNELMKGKQKGGQGGLYFDVDPISFF